MLNTNVIERSISPHCNPLRVVQKSNGDIRLCLDARFLNAIVEDDLESTPLINELTQEYNSAQYFSKLDLKNGYW